MTLTAVNAGAYLHHIALASDRPAYLAAFYASALEMDAKQVGIGEWYCTGPGRRLVFVKGEPRTLAYAGFACRDADGLEILHDRATAEGLAIETTPSPILEDDAFAVRDPDGNLICFGLSKDAKAGRIGLRGPIQHLSLATFGVDALEKFYHGRLGFAVSDRVRRNGEEITTSFLRSNHEHHTVAFFKSNRQGIDHHSYEAGEWDTIRDWADRFAGLRIPLVWGPSTTTSGAVDCPIVTNQPIDLVILPQWHLAEGHAWFDFAALCEGPRAAGDYIEIATEHHTILVGGVPLFNGENDDPARRFVHLVDELYDRHVNLVCTAATDPVSLYEGRKLAHAFERTTSRLIEMQSAEYLALAHRG